MEVIMNKNEKTVGDKGLVRNLIINCLEKRRCCTIKDILYFVRNNGFELKKENIRYYLETLEANGIIQRTKIADKIVCYPTKYKKVIHAILSRVEDRIVSILDKRLLVSTAEIMDDILNHFHIGRDVIHALLRQLTFEGKIGYFFGLSYRGKLFRLYFVPENKGVIEKLILRIKKYVLIKRLVFPNKIAVDDLIFSDNNGGPSLNFLDVNSSWRCFKNILYYLSYLGEINQVYFIQDHPFAVPGHVSELRNLLEKSDVLYEGEN